MAAVKKSFSLPDDLYNRLREIAGANNIPLSQLITELLSVAVRIGPMSFTKIAPEHVEHVLQTGELTIVYKRDTEGFFYPAEIYKSGPVIRGTLVKSTSV